MVNSTSTSASPCSSLHSNLKEKILTFLDPYDQARMQRVSTAWLDTYHSKGGFFAQINSIANLPESAIDYLAEYSVSRKKRGALYKATHPFTNVAAKKAKFSFPIPTSKFNEILDPQSETLGRYLSRVFRAKYRSNPKKAMQFLNQVPPHVRACVKALDLTNSSVTDQDVDHILHLYHNLTSLNLSNTNVTGSWLAKVSNSKLQKISLSNCQNLDLQSLSILLSNVEMLKELDLSYTGITGREFQGINLPNIQSINLSHCEYLQEYHLIDLFTQFGELREVDLSFTFTTGEAVRKLNLKQLERLSLRGCQDLKLLQLEQLLSEAFLRALDLSGTKISGKELLALNLEILEQLDFYNCPNLEREHVESFFELAKTAGKDLIHPER